MPELIIQPSNIDSFIDSVNSNTNYGSQIYLSVADIDTAGAPQKRRLNLKFDCGTLPNPGAISLDQALLYLYYWNGSGSVSGKQINVNRLTQIGWTEAGETWNKYDGVNTWAAAGGDYTTDDAASANVPGGYGWMSWDVTNQVIYALQNVSKIAHFLARFNSESSQDIVASFYSKEYNVDPTKCPKLTLTYKYKNALWFGHA